MKLLSLLPKVLPVVLLIAVQPHAQGQIYSFTSDSVGVYSAVASNATGTNLGRIHGATPPTTACQYGFSSKNFPTTTTFATTLPADTIAVSANSGHMLVVTGFSVDIRRSTTGPQSVRYAYSVDGGATWVNQGTDQAPNNNSCDSMITAAWSVPFAVEYPHKLEFAVFGFNASSTSGTFQIKNLKVNGIVASTASVETIQNSEAGLLVYPNPSSDKVQVSYNLEKEELVSLSVYNIIGQQTNIACGSLQVSGEHSYSIDVATPGIYFLRLTIGDQVITRKFVKH